MNYDGFLAISMLILVGVVIMAIVSIASRSQQSEALIRSWARENGFQVVSMDETQFIGRGDFFWTTSRGQTVYKIVVVDGQGRQRRGRIRCGHWFLGLSDPQIEVRWDG